MKLQQLNESMFNTEEPLVEAGGPVLLVWSDSEGWPEYQKFRSYEEAEAYVDKNLRGGQDWYNPAPLVIDGSLSVDDFEGFNYI